MTITNIYLKFQCFSDSPSVMVYLFLVFTDEDHIPIYTWDFSVSVTIVISDGFSTPGFDWGSLIYTWDFSVSVTITNIYMRCQCICDYHQYIPDISVYQWLSPIYTWDFSVSVTITNIYLRFQCFSDSPSVMVYLFLVFTDEDHIPICTWDFSVSVTIVISDGFSTPGFDWGSLILPEISVYQWLSSSVMVSLLLVLTEAV